MTPSPNPVALVERLRGESWFDCHERLCQGREYSCTCGYDDAVSTMRTEAADEIERLSLLTDDAKLAEREVLIQSLTARIAELEEGLKPFALSAENLDDAHPDHSPIWESPSAMAIDARHLRQARSLLSEEGAG